MATGSSRAARIYLPAERSVPSVTELCLAYWQYAQTYYRDREKTLDHVRRSIRRLRKLYGSVRADEFGAVALKAHKNSTKPSSDK